jgi:hypothetical protein
MTANPWMFGLEAVQLAWQAQIGLALNLMRSFAGSVPDQVKEEGPINSIVVADDTKAEGRIATLPKVPAAVIDMQESPAVAVRRRKTSKIVRGSKTTSKKIARVKTPSAPKRAAATQNSTRKVVRRSARKPTALQDPVTHPGSAPSETLPRIPCSRMRAASSLARMASVGFGASGAADKR